MITTNFRASIHLETTFVLLSEYTENILSLWKKLLRTTSKIRVFVITIPSAKKLRLGRASERLIRLVREDVVYEKH